MEAETPFTLRLWRHSHK